MGRAACAAVAADAGLELVAAVEPARTSATIGRGPDGRRRARAFADAGVRRRRRLHGGRRGRARPCRGWRCTASTSWSAPPGSATTTSLRSRPPAPARVPATASSPPTSPSRRCVMMRLAEIAAPFFDTAEIIELHHDRKIDAPSGFAAGDRRADRRRVVATGLPDPTTHGGRAGRPRRRRAGRDPHPLGAHARDGGAPGGDLRGRRPDAHPAPGQLRPGQLHARPAPGVHAGGDRAPASPSAWAPLLDL